MIKKEEDKIYDEWNKIFFDFLEKMPVWKNRYLKWVKIGQQKNINEYNLDNAYVQLCMINLMYYMILNKDIQEKYFDICIKHFLAPIIQSVLKRDLGMKEELDIFFKSMDESKEILNNRKNEKDK